MTLRLGILGLSPGNGHPFSFSAIVNGYDDAAFAEDREALLSSLPGRGIGRVINVCSDVDSLRTTMELTEKYPQSILEFSNASQKDKLHPTQKPVPLLEYLIKTYTNEGETVLDNCIGSGTTAVACINTNRNYIGFELSEEYCKIAEERIRKI